MKSEDIRKAMGKPTLLRLKEVARGIKVGRVLGNRVLVRIITPETYMDEVERSTSLIIPESVKEANTPRPSTGIVIQVGDLYDDDPVKEGDFVMFSRYAGSDVQIEQEEFRIIETGEIMCTLVKKEEEEDPLSPSAA